jgi:hypothetical protein
MPVPYTFVYQGQIKNYISQFLRIFAGLQVEYGVDRDASGTNDRRTVNVHFGDMDRIVANVLYKDRVFQTQKVPLISGQLLQLELDPERAKAKNHKESITRYTDTIGTKVTETRVMGIPYKLNMDVSIYTSNSEQMLQLLEQILLMFNPILNFQTNENIVDWTYITKAELVAISNEQNVPAATDERLIVQTLSFLVDIWLNYPYKQESSIIEQIIVNMKDNTFNISGLDMESYTVT